MFDFGNTRTPFTGLGFGAQPRRRQQQAPGFAPDPAASLDPAAPPAAPPLGGILGGRPLASAPAPDTMPTVTAPMQGLAHMANAAAQGFEDKRNDDYRQRIGRALMGQAEDAPVSPEAKAIGAALRGGAYGEAPVTSPIFGPIREAMGLPASPQPVFDFDAARAGSNGFLGYGGAAGAAGAQGGGFSLLPQNPSPWVIPEDDDELSNW